MATQAEVAAHLDLTRPVVADLIQRDILPSAKPGNLDLDACRVAYVRHLRDVAAGRGGNELSNERARLAREQADKVARENAVARGEMIPRADVVATLQSAFAHCRARLLSIPTKAAPVVATIEKPAEIKEKLTELVHDALDELARTRGVPVSEDSGRDGDGDRADGGDAGVGAPAKPDGKRVGGSKPRSKSGGKRGAR